MHQPQMRLCIAAAALLAASACAQAGPSTCAVPQPEGPALTNRAATLRQYEQLPQHCLQAMFRECSRASQSGLLDFDSAAACSIGYEALLSKGFNGNFHALLAWWKDERDRVATP